MEKQFVTYEIALKLKELGFNEPCIAKYCRYNPSDDIKLFPQSQNFFKGDGFEYCKNNEYKKEEKTAAPLWQQCLDWLREKHRIEIELPKHQLGYLVHIYKDLCLEYQGDYYIKYYKTREVAILKCIELLKNK